MCLQLVNIKFEINCILFHLFQDVLLRMNLDVKNGRGQCYDGAAMMSGKASGVATQFKLENKRCCIPTVTDTPLI